MDEFSAFSDLELVGLRHKAMKADDEEVVRRISVELGERHKRHLDTRLEYIRLTKRDDGYVLILQFEAGGVAVSLERNSSVKQIIHGLHWVAARLERGFEER